MKSIKRIKNSIINEKLLILVVIVLIIIGLILWLLVKKTKDFGLNFTTEILGAVITVFILDRLIKKREEDKNIPLKIAIYEDIRLYTTRYIGFWIETYLLSVPEDPPKDISDFFSKIGMPKILSYLHLDSEPNVTPSQKWWDWIVHNAKEFKVNGEKILDRYSGFLDPEIFGHLHRLTESHFNGCLIMIPAIRQSDNIYKTPRVKVLGNYSIEPMEDDFKAILGLVNWCENSYNDLLKHKIDLLKVGAYDDYANRERIKKPPKCMIPEDILKKEIEEVNIFRNQQK
jgi:hypothetical protein